jgi:hypothetical protein
MSAAVAQADPTFVLAESQARAGDTVHFTITGADDRVTYELEVADRDVLKGAADADGGVVAGQFTMPDLGDTAKSVQVEAELREDDDKTTVKRKLQYLGHAQPVTVVPAAPAQVTAPAASPQPVQEPAREHTPGAAKAPAEPGAGARRAKRKRRQARERRAARRRDTTSEQSGSRSKQQSRRDAHDSQAKTKRRKGAAPRTAPLFDGVPESQTGGYAAPDDGESAKAPQRKPPAAVVTSPLAGEQANEPAAAILVPGLLGLAGFILAGTVFLRKRRTR